jgi:hypothetical protein
MLEHRYIWERYNFAYLLPWGVVHHKDNNHLNNDPLNLEGMVRSKHITFNTNPFPQGIDQIPTRDYRPDRYRKCSQCNKFFTRSVIRKHKAQSHSY